MFSAPSLPLEIILKILFDTGRVFGHISALATFFLTKNLPGLSGRQATGDKFSMGNLRTGLTVELKNLTKQ